MDMKKIVMNNVIKNVPPWYKKAALQFEVIDVF